MGRASLAMALAGTMTTSACAVVAGLSATYAPAGDPADAAADERAPADDGASAPDGRAPGDAGEVSVPACSTAFVCPNDRNELLCDTFSSSTLDARWTRFDSTSAGFVATKIDPSFGCPRGSLDESSATDTDYGVYGNVGPLDDVTIDADVFIDAMDLGGEGDLFKIAVPNDYDVRLHYANGEVYVLEVDNTGPGTNYRHNGHWRADAGAWIHFTLELDRGTHTCSLAVDGVAITDSETLSLTPPSGDMQVALSPRRRSGGVVRIHVDNVVVHGT